MSYATPDPPKGSLPGRRGIQHFGLTEPFFQEQTIFRPA